MSPVVNQQFDRLMRKGAFNPTRRFLSTSDADDRLAEGIGMAYEASLRKAEQGIILDDAIVVLAVRLRAIDIRRRFVKGGQPRRDALHRANYVDGRTEVLHLDGLEDETDGWPREGDVGLQVAWAAALTEDPTEKLDSAIDLAEWLTSLAAVDRALLSDRMAGLSFQEVADHADLSLTVAFHRLRRLGVALAAHADLEVARKQRKPRKRPVAPRC